MKEVKAYIQPFMLQTVTDMLHKIGIHGMSVWEIRGFGKEKDESYPHHSRDYVVEFTTKMRVEIICTDEDAERIAEVIREGARTGRRGDGKIIVTEVESVLSIRSGKRGDDAI